MDVFTRVLDSRTGSKEWLALLPTIDLRSLQADASRIGESMRLKRFVIVALIQSLCAAGAPAMEPIAVSRSAREAIDLDSSHWRGTALKLALDNAVLVEDAYRRAEALASIARAQAGVDQQATTGAIQRALAAAQQVTETEFRGWVLHDVVLAQIAVEDMYGAHETAGSIEADRPHGEALAALAEIEIRRGDLAAAQALASRIRDPGAQGQVLRQIISTRATRGELEAARSLLRLIKDPFYEALARGDVAVAEVRAGRVERAHELAARARRKQRAEVYGRIALACVSRHDLRCAFDTLQKVPDVLHRAVVQGRIAALRAESGELEGARQLFTAAVNAAESAPDSYSKAMTLARLGRMQAVSGDHPPARALLRRAQAQAERLPRGDDRDDVLDSIARGQARAGDVHGALQSALLSDDRIARALLVRDVVTLQGDATLESATAAASPFDDALIDAAALFGVLGVQVMRRGASASEEAVDAARAAVRRIDDPQLKPAAFAALAAAGIRFDGEQGAAIFHEALVSAAALERAEQRATAYVRIAAALNERLVFLGRPAKASDDESRG